MTLNRRCSSVGHYDSVALEFMDLQKLTSVTIDNDRLDLIKSTYRPYYTEVNADSVKKIFDDYASNPKTTLVPISHLGYAIRTLANRLSYGLKWLSERHPDKEKYLALKSTISLRICEGGVLILPKRKLSEIVSVQVVDDEIKKKWMDKFTDWCASAKENDIFDSYQYYGGILTISEQDEVALIRYCAQANIELELKRKEGIFRAMR